MPARIVFSAPDRDLSWRLTGKGIAPDEFSLSASGFPPDVTVEISIAIGSKSRAAQFVTDGSGALSWAGKQQPTWEKFLTWWVGLSGLERLRRLLVLSHSHFRSPVNR